MAQPQPIDKYEPLEELGRGGFAVVYRARDAKMGREVALKVIAGNFAQEPAFIERFRHEALTAANLRHPRIVTVYDFGDADGTLYLAMALIGEGRTLRDLLAEQGPLCLEHALPILAQLAEALDYLHGGNPPLTHRDVKPANVLLEGEGDNLEVVLTDFGLVRSMEASTELTKSGTILGTLAYMAPEQANPKLGQVGPAADLYALGVVAYEMLTGRVPFEGEAATLLHAHAYEEPPSPLEFVPDLGDDLSEALLRALVKSPAKRYPSAGSFVAALQQAADARTTAAEREATLERLEAQARELLDAGEWLEALECCTQMIRLDPGWFGALEMLAAAKEGLDRAQAEAAARRKSYEEYEKALQLFGEEQWYQATLLLEGIVTQNPDFRDAAELLKNARNEMQKVEWLRAASSYVESKQWQEACEPLTHLLGIDPDNHSAVAMAVQVMNGLLSALQELSRDRRSQALAHFDALVKGLEDDDQTRVLEAARQMLVLVVTSPTVEEVQRRWPEILDKIRPLDRSLEALLRSGSLVAVEDGNTVVLQFPYAFHQERVAEPHSKAIVEQSLSEILGQPMEIRCILGRREDRHTSDFPSL